ncbi:Ies1p [Rhodotorula paludigena]|uniref:Ies1p n=1 Tax=Rhodotorula paludigena TaxID=86838 RepID=UPI00316DDFFE
MPPKRTAEELHALSHPRSKRSYKETNWAIKKLDSEPLLRQDIQWQVLDDIFNDRSFRFTAPVDRSAPPADPIYLNFDQLYLEAILSSMKTTQNIRTKLISNPEFAINYCKICLLVNVGRINTTLAFYPNMRTALRTYHPVPSLQTEKVSQSEMSDAPRIKGALKAAMLDWEVNNVPTTLREVAARAASGEIRHGPPTTVIEAIFLLFNEAGWISEKYFPDGFDLWDIFFPSDMPSQPRARAFLSLLHHVLENKSFLDDFDAPSGMPRTLNPPIQLQRDLPAGAPRENVDPPHELAFAAEMKAVRDGVVKTVPAIQKKEEEAREKMKQQAEKEQGLQAGGDAPAKRAASSVRAKASFARQQHRAEMAGQTPEILPPGWRNETWNHSVPQKSGLNVTWLNIKQDLLSNRDPDYDSDEEGSWPYDTLLRRATLTTLNPATGKRESARNFKEFDEWVRRRESGYVSPKEEFDDGLDDLDGGASDMGDAE